tara:strand:- start:2018 stop:2248 length:231 start_codon:yes stop_codon:yes gene_type:complete
VSGVGRRIPFSDFKGDRTLIVAGPLRRLLLLLRRPTELHSCCCDGAAEQLVPPRGAASSWQHLEKGREAKNDETTL